MDTPRASPSLSSSAVQLALFLLQSNDICSKVEAAGEIRRLTRSSQRCRRHLGGAVQPLVSMLRLASPVCHEAALLALLNLAVKDQLNKVSIVQAGALEPINRFLRSKATNIQDLAVVALLTLSASTINKPVIGASGAIPLLVEILRNGSSQAKADSVMALYNLSTYQDNVTVILKAKPVPAIVNVLKTSKKSSRTADKCSALIESLVGFDEGRTALTSEEGGVLALVEVLENGSQLGREHAVEALLVICQSKICKYREPILREGPIPGLLELTVQGTPKSQSKARKLLKMLRDPRSDVQEDSLDSVVCSIISEIDGADQARKAKKKVAEMVRVSMEQCLRQMQQRALVNSCC